MSDREENSVIAALSKLFDQYQIDIMIETGRRLTVDAGAPVLRQGYDGKVLLVLVGGTAVVTRDGERVAELGPGDVFGEGAALSWHQRNAAVTAETDLELLGFTAGNVATLLRRAPNIGNRLRQLADDRLPT